MKFRILLEEGKLFSDNILVSSSESKHSNLVDILIFQVLSLINSNIDSEPQDSEFLYYWEYFKSKYYTINGEDAYEFLVNLGYINNELEEDSLLEAFTKYKELTNRAITNKDIADLLSKQINTNNFSYYED